MGKKNSITIRSIEKEVSIGETVIYADIGKYECTLVAVNKPSEEAIMRCRKVVNEVMRNYLNKKTEREESD
ncbi:hypothetical protein [Lysinibacillus parviboronicapiens]|uniref:hypothetical protein n=1 Tax=Lysinibacillus parviboronicapiens TaxID=436516 RepID=UPI000D3B08E1|nr:hypothetical protein [Lysinibacillus parviboronicapiens]